MILVEQGSPVDGVLSRPNGAPRACTRDLRGVEHFGHSGQAPTRPAAPEHQRASRGFGRRWRLPAELDSPTDLATEISFTASTA